MSGRNRYEALQAIRAVLADDCVCDPDDFTRDAVIVTPHELRPHRRRYPVPAVPFIAVTMGTGVVIDPRGYVLTNFHVVDGVRQINVTLSDGEQFVAGHRHVEAGKPVG